MNRVLRQASAIGACAFLLLFALPLRADYSATVLAALAAIAILTANTAHVPLAALPPFGRRWTRDGRRLTAAIVAFCLVSSLSLALSIDVPRSLGGSAAFLPGLLLWVLIGGYFQSLRQVRWLFAVLCSVSLGLSLAVVATALAHPDLRPAAWIQHLPSPVLVVPNDAILFTLVLPIAWLPLRRRWEERRAATPEAPGRWEQIEVGLGFAASLAAVAASVLAQSRGAIVVAVAVTLALAWLWRSRRVLWLAGGGLVLAIALDRLALHGQLAAKFTNLLDTRLALWLTAGQMFLDRPWLGHGPNTFGALYQSYLGELQLNGRLPVDPRVIPWPHNLYLELLAERGLAGLAAGVAVLVAVGMAARDLRAQPGDTAAARESRRMATAVLACTFGLACAALFELTLLRLWVVVLWLLLAGVMQMLLRQAAGQLDIATSGPELAWRTQ